MVWQRYYLPTLSTIHQRLQHLTFAGPNMKFSDVVGQHTLKATLIANALTGRVAHAQLLLGPEGCGALPLAIAYARYLQCTNPGDTEACGFCSNCTKATKHVHPDIHFSYPTVGTGVISTQVVAQWRKAIVQNPYMSRQQWLSLLDTDNKQGNINKDECADILRKLSFKTFEGRYKILIMWLPEYLGKEGNRLLKMIEEPPDNTLFLLVAERSDQILSTILSRCQIITVPALSDDDLRQALIERQELLPEEAATITYLSNGSYAQALTLVTGTQLVPTDLLVDWLRTCWKGEPLALVTWAEQFAAIGREPQKQYFLYALHYLRELLRVAAGEVTAGQTLRLPASEQTTARKMAATFGFERIATAVSLFDEVIYYIERNANPKVLFLDTAIRLHRILHHKTAH